MIPITSIKSIRPLTFSLHESGRGGPIEPPGADLDLAAVIAAWPTLPPAVRARVMVLVRDAGDTT
jgi:hypothetical protein